MLESSFEFYASLGGILHAEAAEIGADAGLHHANAFGVSLAARHAEVCPNFGQVGFFHAEEIYALTAGDFNHRHFVFFGDVCDTAELLGGGDAATHARDNGERAVLLNVGVHAVIDIARGSVFVVVATPDDIHHVTQRWLADFAAEAVAINIKDLLDGKDALAANDVAELFFAVREAFAENAFCFFLKFRDDGFEELLTVFSATAAASGGARAFFQLGERVDAFGVNGVNDRALGDADAAADDFGVRHGRDVEARILGWSGKKKLSAMRCEIFAGAEPVH